MEDFEKLVAQFEANLKPVAKAKLQEVAPAPETLEVKVEEAPPAAPSSPLIPAGEPCLTQVFKKLVYALPPEFIGEGGSDIKDMITQLVDSLPQCAA